MKQKSLLSSIRFLFLVSIPIPFLLISILFSYFYNKQLLANNERNISDTLSSVASSIGIYISELNSIANIPYFYPDIFDTMDDINLKVIDASENTVSELPAGKPYRVAFLKYMYNSSQPIDSVTFYPRNNPGKNAYVLSRNATNTSILENDSYYLSSWYALLEEDNMASAFFPEYDENNKLVSFSYAKNIRDVDSKRNIGTIKINSSANPYEALLNKVSTGNSSSLCLAKNSGEILYNNSKSEILLSISHISNLPKSFFGYQIIEMPISDTDLQLLYISSNLELFSYQFGAFWTVFMITAISICFAFFIYQQRAKQLTLTVSSIKDSLKKVASGDLKSCDIQSSEKEFGEIANAINDTITQLNEHVIREYKLELAQQTAEYRALQAQINPHFLYNTLNGFIALNRMGEKKLLEHSIIRLTHLFQYTCNANTLVPLSDEVSFIRQYLELQSLKYDERLHFTFDCDPNTLAIPIPKLLLQPLIENAIIHGLEPTDRTILIRISSFLTSISSFGNYLVLLVEDNGLGFENHSNFKNEHVGLSNIKSRLKYYNRESLFHIESTPLQGTRCIILLKQ